MFLNQIPLTAGERNFIVGDAAGGGCSDAERAACRRMGGDGGG